ncbi:hypothetical protein C4577_06585 [Candidatus Parcubacteria bacterium]|nr:MAG: hypothetical protein C4577_06585 [Candidatus Parcubacteria bacterium]
MPIPNPRNNFVPKVGDKVRIIGGCHPRALGKVVLVYELVVEDNWYGSLHIDPFYGEVYSGGELGGLEPVSQDTPIDTF